VAFFVQHERFDDDEGDANNEADECQTYSNMEDLLRGSQPFQVEAPPPPAQLEPSSALPPVKTVCLTLPVADHSPESSSKPADQAVSESIESPELPVFGHPSVSPKISSEPAVHKSPMIPVSTVEQAVPGPLGQPVKDVDATTIDRTVQQLAGPQGQLPHARHRPTHGLAWLFSLWVSS
jgi:hypothetical protein